MAQPLAQAIQRAAQLRAGLLAVTDAYRLHDAHADAASSGLSGATIERFGDFAVLYAFERRVVEAREAIAHALLDLGVRGVYLKPRLAESNGAAPDEFMAPIAGEQAPGELVVFEHERRFQVYLESGLSVGLYVDQRDNRARLQADCHGAKVLNLFCYTGSFSVAAGLGGASSVTSVDASRVALGRTDQNLALNGLAKERHRLLKADVPQWLQRAGRRGDRFDWIVLDPPSFSTRARPWGASAYTELAARCCTLLSAGGRLIAVSHHNGTSPARFERILMDAAAQSGRRVARREQLPASVDCPPVLDPSIGTKSVLLSVE